MARSARRLPVALLSALLAVLFGAHAFAAPPTTGKLTAVARTAAELARHDKLSALAKGRDRDALGRFLPQVKEADIRARAYEKFEARNRAAGHQVDGHDQEDYYAAKRELQAEKSAAHRAALVEKEKAAKPASP
jgi:hypothetical protein